MIQVSEDSAIKEETRVGVPTWPRLPDFVFVCGCCFFATRVPPQHGSSCVVFFMLLLRGVVRRLSCLFAVVGMAGLFSYVRVYIVPVVIGGSLCVLISVVWPRPAFSAM